MSEPYDFDKLWNYGDPAGTETKFRELIPDAEAGGNREYHLQLLTQVARTMGLQRKFDEAHELLDQAAKEMDTGTPVAHIRFLLEKGRVYNSSGKKDKARPLFLKAWEEAQEAGADYYAVDAAHMLGIVDSGGDGLAWNLKAIAFAEQSESKRARNWLGSLLNNTGWSYHELGQYETALDLFRRALEFREQQGDPENIRIAKWCVARCLRSLGRNDEALAMQQVLLVESEAEGGEPGYTYEELGELLLLEDKKQEARNYFAKAHAVLSRDPWLVEHEPDRLSRLKKLGGLDA